MLPFLPGCLPLPPGALPHRVAAEALGVLARYAAPLLIWPHLPRRADVEQPHLLAAHGFPGLVTGGARASYVDRTQNDEGLARLQLAYLQADLSRGAIAGTAAAGLYELLRGETGLGRTRALVGWLMGPVSVCLQMVDDQQRPLIYDPALREAMAQFLWLRAGWMAQALGVFGRPVLIGFEEPMIDALESPFAPLASEEGWSLLDLVLRGNHGPGILALGSPRQLRAALERPVQVVAVPAYGLEPSVAALAEPLEGFLTRGGALALGVVPSSEEALGRETGATLLARVEGLLDELGARGLPRERIVPRLFVGLDGSLGALVPAVAERALALLSDVSDGLRQRYGLM